MPVNGGTRMLRARRKDINVKPNRRLDRKSSRGMLFENEELRMRTITINAEVEQGQHALKKLRRENEQLRREMWSLRDEYDKMEKLLRKKETDEESDQENSYTDDDYTQSGESDEDKKGGGDDSTTTAPDSPQPKFGNPSSGRAFDGLSVIDEQTEETTTQTTEGLGSRSNSANRTFTNRPYDEEYPVAFFEPTYQTKLAARKKGFPGYDNPEYVAYGTDWPDNGYGNVRPASPYPYPDSVQPSYQKRFEVLTRPAAIPVAENGWMFPGGQKPGGYVGYMPDKPVTSPISIQIPNESEYSVIRDRSGPDVFISGACAKKSVDVPSEVTGGAEVAAGTGATGGRGGTATTAGADDDDGIIKKVEAEIEKMDIGDARADGQQEQQIASKSDSVQCQNPTRRDAPDDMAKSSTFQSKLMVTLKTPSTTAGARTDPRTLKRVPPVQCPTRTGYQTFGYGIKPEYAKRYVGFPEVRYQIGDTIPASGCQGLETADIPVQDGLGLLTEADPHLDIAPLKPVKIPPAPPPRTTSCLGQTIIPEPQIGVTAIHHRTFRRGKSPPILDVERYPDPMFHNPLMLAEPMATSSPRIFQRPHNLSLDNLSVHRRLAAVNDESSTEDVSRTKSKCDQTPHLNKSVSSPSFGTFLRRKPSEYSVSSMENGVKSGIRSGVMGNPQNNASVSSSSGLDSPAKDRRKRRVSIKFNKKGGAGESDVVIGHRETCAGDRKGRAGKSGRIRSDETDVTTSERERTNSVSSRASSVAGRKFSVASSSKAYVNDEKIPWCGCWGNGCV